MKVAFVTNIPAPYRNSFFNELSKYCELDVFYENRCCSNRSSDWLKIEYNFHYSFLTENNNFYKLKKSLINYDAIVISVYSTKYQRKLISFMKRHHIKYWFSSDGGFPKKDIFIKKMVKKYYISGAYGYLSTGKITDEYLIKYGAKKDAIFRYPFSSFDQLHLIYNYKKNDSNNNFQILGVGQIIYRKGWDLLLKSLSMIKHEVHLQIVGGNISTDLKAIVNEYNLENVEFIDFVEKNAIYEYYKKADLFVLPTREDIWGLVVNEAMSQGVPVITTNKCIAGLELLKNGYNGYVLDINDENNFIINLANLIDSLVEKKEKLKELSVNSFETIKNYTTENMAKTCYEIIKKGVK